MIKPYEKAILREGEVFKTDKKIFIGKGTSIGDGCQFRVFTHDEETISIGDGCAIADNVFMVTNWGSHLLDAEQSERSRGSISIGNGVWIGHGAMIRGGVTIGNYAIIGMGAVVTKDVPSGHVVVGNPGQDIGLRKDGKR